MFCEGFIGNSQGLPEVWLGVRRDSLEVNCFDVGWRFVEVSITWEKGSGSNRGFEGAWALWVWVVCKIFLGRPRVRFQIG